MSTSSGENCIKIRRYLPELMPKNSPNWAQLGHKAKKKLVYPRGKVKNGKYQDLKTWKFINYG